MSKNVKTIQKPRGDNAIQERKRRLDYARNILTAKKKVDFDKAVALLSFNLGITERKAKEYINTLILVDGIKKVGDEIVRRG